jgi:hypothetical protein
MFVEEHESKLPPEQLRRGMGNNIKQGFKETVFEDVDRIELALYRDQWRALASKLMKDLRFPRR